MLLIWSNSVLPLRWYAEDAQHVVLPRLQAARQLRARHAQLEVFAELHDTPVSSEYRVSRAQESRVFAISREDLIDTWDTLLIKSVGGRHLNETDVTQVWLPQANGDYLRCTWETMETPTLPELTAEEIRHAEQIFSP